jgi:hypothetical protein
VFWPSSFTRIGSLIGIATVAIAYTVLFFLFLVFGFIKAGDSASSATSVLNPINMAMAVINVVTDFYIMLLPIPTVLHLKLARKKKWGVFFVFSTGFLLVSVRPLSPVSY